VKKVDVCLVLDPRTSTNATDHAMADRIESRRRSLLEYAMNYTALEAVDSRPITVSIETKSDGVSLLTAELQIGTWRSLRWIPGQRPSSPILQHLRRPGTG
jgi:hypothetical protein